MTAIEQLDRLLLLLSKLETGQPMQISKLAEELQVDRKVLLKDLETLVKREHAEPAGFMEAVSVAFDGERVWSERPSPFRRPMALTRQEAVALDVALAMLLFEYPSSDREAIEGVRQKLRSIRLDAEEPGEAPLAVRVGQGNSALRNYRAELERCVASRQMAQLFYMKADAEAPSPRLVGPVDLACVRGVWYLFARNGADGEVRQFRLDRVHGVEVQEARFERPVDFDVRALLDGGRPFLGEASERVRIIYRGSAARWIAEDEGGELAPDGSIVKEYPLADPDWAVRQALRFGSNAEVLAPASVRRRLVERLARAAGV